MDEMRVVVVNGKMSFRDEVKKEVQTQLVEFCIGFIKVSLTRSLEYGLKRMKEKTHSYTVDPIFIRTKEEAQNIIDELTLQVRQEGHVSVDDLYSLSGVYSRYTSHKWGWTDVSGIVLKPEGDGFTLSMPAPKMLKL